MIIKNQGTPKNWRAAVDAIKASRAEIKKMQGFSNTPDYLIQAARDDVEQLRQLYRPMISEGAMAEYNAALEGWQKANGDYTKARTQEISQWSPRDLLIYSDHTRERIAAILSGDVMDSAAVQELQDLYQEARDSGNPQMQRGAAEAFKGINAMVSVTAPREVQIVAHTLYTQATRDLAQMRNTAELQAAQDKIHDAEQTLLDQKDSMLALAKEVDGEELSPLGAISPFARAALRIKVEPDTVKILAPDDPEVTGVDNSQLWAKAGPPEGQGEAIRSQV